MAISLIAGSTAALAGEAANSSKASLTQTIAHLEKAIAEVNKSDFAAANIHLKAVRSSSEQITGNEAIVKQANATVIQGQIQSKQGQTEKASVLLNKGLELYKSL